MIERGEAGPDPLEPIVVADIPDANATIDQPISDTGDQFETNDYEGFLDLGFMQQVFVSAVPLNIVYPSSCFEGDVSQEFPQGTNSDIDFDDAYLSTKLNRSCWKFDRKKFGEKAHCFNNNMDKQHIVSNLYNQINRKKLERFLRKNPNPIIRVRCTKPKNDSLKLHLVRKKTEYEYTEVMFAHQLVKFSYNKWMQILEIINKYKSVHAQEVKLEIQQLLNKVKKPNLVPSTGPLASSSRSASSGRTDAPQHSKTTRFLLPYGTRYINDELPIGVEPIQYMFIPKPEHGIFYLNSQNQICFQRTDGLPSAPTEHLF
ncbi:unnamed protein product [Lactuca saligna]|uniref:Uncharacterized protein n=1 Tax=Lactuca saligna TaxID=75948 RepID=A0AA35VFW7_LACSI|nr:unnamed protein product [Lactuca saligna]